MNSETQIQIERLVFRGYGPKRLAKLFGGSEKRYRNLVRELGGAKAKPFDMPDEKVIELWNLGYGIKRIARMFRCRNTKVLETFRRLGLQDANRDFNTPHGAKLGAALQHQRAEPGKIEAIIMDGYRRESRALKQGDERRHWSDHLEVVRWLYQNTPGMRSKAREAARGAYRKNREKYLSRAKAFYEKNKTNPDYIQKRKADMRAWKSKNRHLPYYRIMNSFRSRLHQLIRGVAGVGKASELVSCSRESLIEHIESQFSESMSWANYGKHWHIDHIMPCSAFDLEDPVEMRECFHFSNLQPLEAIANMQKGAKWT